MNCRGGRRRRRAQRVYRVLVRLYPAAHRRAFGEQMVQMFGDHYRDAVEGRGGSRLRFWLAVLADAATSLVTEHVAEVRAGYRRAKATRRRYRLFRRADRRRTGGARQRRVRVARRLRYRRNRVPAVLRTPRRRRVRRRRIAALLVLVVLAGAALGTGTATGHPGIGAIVAGLATAACLAYILRLTRRVPAGPRGDGPTPPGGASMREPRRPLPMSPAGAAARPRPDQDEPGQAVALT